MLQNAYFLAKIGADTAEIELDFVEMLSFGVAAPPVQRRPEQPRRRRREQQVEAERGKISIFGGEFANFLRARSRLYQNEILQENMRLTALFRLYKMCTLFYRCDRKIFAKNRFEKSAIFVKIS